MKIIETYFLNEIKRNEYSLWEEEEINEHVNECIKIADKHAISFVCWLLVNQVNYKEKKLKELLEMYNEQTDF